MHVDFPFDFNLKRQVGSFKKAGPMNFSILPGPGGFATYRLSSSMRSQTIVAGAVQPYKDSAPK